MKKILVLLVAISLLFSMSGCCTYSFGLLGQETPKETAVIATISSSAETTQPTEETTTQAPTTTIEPTTQAPTTTEAIANKITLPLLSDGTQFLFSSGAGGWGTTIYLNRDGSFTGKYSDSEMGDIGEGYPNGSVYTCEFSGEFVNIEKLNDYSYMMTLSNVVLQEPAGKEWIEDGRRFISAEPYGLVGTDSQLEGNKFIFYLPATPVSQLSDDFLSWWPYRYEHGINPIYTLSCYGILNVANNNGFFYRD